MTITTPRLWQPNYKNSCRAQLRLAEAELTRMNGENIVDIGRHGRTKALTLQLERQSGLGKAKSLRIYVPV